MISLKYNVQKYKKDIESDERLDSLVYWQYINQGLSTNEVSFLQLIDNNRNNFYDDDFIEKTIENTKDFKNTLLELVRYKNIIHDNEKLKIINLSTKKADA